MVLSVLSSRRLTMTIITGFSAPEYMPVAFNLVAAAGPYMMSAAISGKLSR